MRLQVLKNGVCVPDAHMIVNFAYVLGIACFKLEAILVTPVLRHLQVDASNLNDCFLFLPAQEGPRRPRTTPACFPGLSPRNQNRQLGGGGAVGENRISNRTGTV